MLSRNLMHEDMEVLELLRQDAETVTLRVQRNGAVHQARLIKRCNLSTARLARFARVCADVGTLAYEPSIDGLTFVGRNTLGQPVLLSSVSQARLVDIQAVRPVGADEAMAVLTTVCTALAALHAVGIVHGSVHPSTVVMSGGRWKLTDVGLDATLGLSRTLLERRSYLPGERAEGVARNAADDVFAVGALGADLFRAAPDAAALRGLIADCSNPDPDRRPTAEQLVLRLTDARAAVTLTAVVDHRAI